MIVGFIGLGRAGANMARLFLKNRHRVLGYDPFVDDAVSRFLAKEGVEIDSLKEVFLKSECLVIAVPDDDMIRVVNAIEKDVNAKMIGHLSGSSDVSVFADLPPDIERFSLHPMRAFASPFDDISDFDEVFFGVEGLDRVYQLLKRCLPTVANRMIKINSLDKVRYHLSAVEASNFILGVLNHAEMGYLSMGIQAPDARKIVGALARSALENYLTYGAKDGLTGPIARGDVSTIEKHLSILKPAEKEVYQWYSIQLVRLLEDGLSLDVKERIVNLLEKES